MLPQLSLFQQCPIQSQDVMQTWLHWRRQDALLVQKHFVALFHPKPNECLRFDLESCNLMCTYTVVTHPCHIPPLAQAHPVMLCIYTRRRCDHVICKLCHYSAWIHLHYKHVHKLHTAEIVADTFIWLFVVLRSTTTPITAAQVMSVLL